MKLNLNLCKRGGGGLNHQSQNSFVIEEMRQSLSRLMKKKMRKGMLLLIKAISQLPPLGHFNELLYILPDKRSSYLFRFEVV